MATGQIRRGSRAGGAEPLKPNPPAGCTDSAATQRWTVYIIRCDDGSLYTGITTDLTRRLKEHGGSRAGARYFNGRKPEAVVFEEPGHDRASASRREAAIKKLSRQEKLQLLRA